VFSHVDVVPTVLGLCGVKPPAKMDGHDFAPYLRGERAKTPEYARFQDKPWVLYDLEKDPHELEVEGDRI
jgi:arylsulfatase A-like enzyme